MPVIVHDELIADLFGVETRTRRAEGTETNGDVEQPINTCAQRRERRCAIEHRQGP